MKLKITARVITYDETKGKVLLVKNRGASFWYPPGGGWEYEKENILDGATREVKEETGLDVKILRLLYVQEFHDQKDSIFFETIWLAKPMEHTKLNELHIDLDPNGQVETAKWFSKDELRDLKVFPERLKNTFWENINKFLTEEDPFIGVN